MERDSFIFRKKWYDAIKDLDAETKAQAFDAICQFAIYHQKVEMNPMVKMAMAFIMPDLEEDCKKWMDIREKRSEAGRKGNEKRWAESQTSQMIANAIDESQTSQSIANIAVSSLFNSCNNISFLAHMCAGSEEKKEEFLFEIEKEMLRKGAAKPSKEAERFISYNDSQGWLLKSGRNITDPVAWAKNWIIANPSQEIIQSAEAYIRLLQAARITDRKMLDSLKEISADGNMITLKLTSKKAVETFLKAETDETIERMLLAINLCFPEIQNPQLTYFSPTKLK